MDKLINNIMYFNNVRLKDTYKTCKHCNLKCTENKFHFLSECPLYETKRTKLYSQIQHVNTNFTSLSDYIKAKWLLLQEDQSILAALGTYIHICFEKRTNQRTNGPVNAHLISWPSKAQNIQNLEHIWYRNNLDL